MHFRKGLQQGPWVELAQSRKHDKLRTFKILKDIKMISLVKI